jgi:hypothetical protein
MKSKFNLSPELYGQMLDRLNTLHLTDKLGFEDDLLVFKNDYWLCNSAVVERIMLRKGTWDVVLVFVDFSSPFKLLARRITSNPCPKRAFFTACLMRRLAAKDQRGTIEVPVHQFSTPIN